jgi:hypothetical protein
MKLKYTFSFSFIFLFFLSLASESYELIAITLVCLIILSILYKLGSGIITLEGISLFYAFTCLIMPIVGYNFYTQDYFMSRLFKKYMQVPESVYFGYALPALILFTTILTFPYLGKKVNDSGESLYNHIDRIKSYLKSHKKVGALIMLVGSLELVFGGIFPQSFRFFFDIFFFSAFAGLLMIYLSDNTKYKLVLIPAFLSLVLYKALQSSMFTVVAYMTIAISSFFFIGNKTGFIKKIVIFFLGCFFILVLQNTKMAYRKIVRVGTGTAQVSDFISIAQQQFLSPTNFFQVKEFYPLYVRFNQGYNVSVVMKRIPAAVPFDEGDMVKKSLLASITPRFLWPDKPMAGGHFNMKYYAGITIKNFSTNVGPLGEAYGAFGVLGGTVMMGLIALFIRFAYYRIWRIAYTYPIMILWIPVVFYQATYSAENDILQILNSIIKTAAFLWLVSKVQPKWFGIVKEKRR